MGFSQLTIPVERHPTEAARTALSAQLGFEDTHEFQDWERHFQNFEKIMSFVDLYEAGTLNEDEKFLLMELVLASASDADAVFFVSSDWRRIEDLLRRNSTLHAWSMWFWSCIDNESRIPYNDFASSPYIQSILLETASDSPQEKPFNNPDNEDLVIRFGKFWWSNFENCSPAGHKLRTVLNDRWVRFHSLPESKRHPDNAAELGEVIGRMNALADEVLGQGAVCWLIANRYADTPSLACDTVGEYDLRACLGWIDPDVPLHPAVIIAHASICRWEPARFEGLLAKIARHDDANILWVSETGQAVFAPYDGGVDIILPDASQVTALAYKYAGWLSPYPGGL